MVCGYEVLTPITDTLKYVKYKDTGTHDLRDLTTLFSSNVALCPVNTWILKEQILGVMQEHAGLAYVDSTSKKLKMKTDAPYSRILFIEALSSAPVKALKQIEVKVCGNEIIRPIATTPEFVYLLGTGSKQAFEATSIFSVDDPDCPFNGVVISKSDSPLYTTYVGTDVFLKSGSGSLKYVTVSTDKLMDKTQFGVKAETVTPANQAVLLFNVTVCKSSEAIAGTFVYRFNQSSTSVIVGNVSSFFSREHVCPGPSYALG